MSKDTLLPWIQPSPLGPILLLARSSGALLACTWPDAEATDPLQSLVELKPLANFHFAALRSLSYGPEPGSALDTTCLPARLGAVATQLDDYLAGRREGLKLAVDLALARTDFYREVLEALYAVPYRSTTTYGELAQKIGRPKASRAVGQAVGWNPLAIVVPCHRVLASDGSLGGFSGGLWRKRFLLQLEGHKTLGDGWQSRRSTAADAAAPIAVR